MENKETVEFCCGEVKVDKKEFYEKLESTPYNETFEVDGHKFLVSGTMSSGATGVIIS